LLKNSLKFFKPMNSQSALWTTLLGIEAPWVVTKFQFNHSLKRVDIWIGVQHVEIKSGWFGSKKSQAAPVTISVARYEKWRHLNLAGWQTYIHSPWPTPVALLQKSWVGEAGQQFSHALSRLVFTMMGEGATLATICAALQVSLTDLWKYKLALDKGTVGSSAQVIKTKVAAVQTLANTHAAAAARESMVPSLDDPVWQALATGSREIEIKTLSLRLLLTRVKSQFQMAADDEVRALRIRELHRFFEKNQRALSHELGQLLYAE
jgi:hypothetical protein